jgi:magnesium transporter
VKVDNPLSQEFLLSYPREAARVLEKVSTEHVVALFAELPALTSAPVVAFMLPEIASACLGQMTVSSAAKLITELPISPAAHIYRLLAKEKQDEVTAQLTEKTRKRIQRYLQYPAQSAGALLDPKIDTLPENVTVAEAIHRIEHLGRTVSCEIYVTDDTHHLVGMIDVGKLLTSSHHARMRDVMNRKSQSVFTQASAETLLSHPGWRTRRRLPVVERDNTLVGALDYNRLHDSVGEMGTASSRDPLENLLSLAGLYWLSLAQLLDSLLSIPGSDKGGRK